MNVTELEARILWATYNNDYCETFPWTHSVLDSSRLPINVAKGCAGKSDCKGLG